MNELLTMALWGLSSSGKTAFLAQLYLQHSPDWYVYPSPESQGFLDLVQPQLEANCFPGATAVSESIQKASYIFQNRKTKREAALVVEDRAGRESENLTEEGKKRLTEARGLVLLFDPENPEKELEQKVEKTLSRLNWFSGRGAKKDDRPIAICLSKSDLFIRTPNDLKLAIEKPREFVLEKITPNVLNWVDKFCNNFELFPISSVGVRLSFGVIEPAIFRDETLKLRLGSGGGAVNLLEPLAWLFDQLEHPVK